MLKFYRDYIWKNGIPYGIEPLEESNQTPSSFKIVMDPYRRRISIEKYSLKREFTGVIYDSALINFRKLSPELQTRWQRCLVFENERYLETLLRDEDDRVLYREKAVFDHNLCRECQIESPHGILLAIQKIFYTKLNDPFDGVILYDSIKKPVMMKTYAFDTQIEQFGDILTETWDVNVLDGLYQPI